ncbi:hypothetical protein Tco_1414195 [Tanacetum coccineum]
MEQITSMCDMVGQLIQKKEEEKWKRISEKRMKNQEKRTKPSTEWKSMEKPKSNQSKVQERQSQQSKPEPTPKNT